MRAMGGLALILFVMGLGWGVGRNVELSSPDRVRASQGGRNESSSGRWSIWSPPIRAIEVHGAHRLTEEEVRKRLGFREGDGRFTVSLRAAVERLLAHPWVASVTLSRALPDRVVIAIQERHPVAIVRDGRARWSVDADGHLLAPVSGADDVIGMEVSGLSLEQLRAGSSEQAYLLRHALALMAVLRQDGVQRAAAVVRGDEGIVVSLGERRLLFGLGQYEEQWKRYWQVVEHLPADEPRGREIDLRFANSVVVRM